LSDNRKGLRTKVNRHRWEQAQSWERDHWILAQKARSKWGKDYIWRILAFLRIKPKYRGDDWNYWWKKQFNNYEFLPDKVENAIELGCGPYTNMRLIIEKCMPKHIFLSDPLIRTYVNFSQTFVAYMYKEGKCIIDDHPIEECPFADNYFDLTVMINVLDHVMDAELCITKAIAITKPGGILLIGQDLTNEEDIERKKGEQEDVGHPIKIDHEFLNSFLEKKFEPILYKILPREEGRNPQAHYGTFIFAGRKIGG